MQEKELFLWTEKAADAGSRRIVAAVSSEAIDRDGEIITAAAMKAAFPEFMKNPVILAAHSHRLDSGVSSVIGRVVSWYQQGKKTFCEIEFADTPLGLQYWTLYSGKFQKAFSIGFRSIPGKQERRNIDGKTVVVHTEIELYEISAVAVPANPEALSKAAKRRQEFVKSKSDRRDDDVKALDYLDDFYAGRLEGIPEKSLVILKRLDLECSEIPEGDPGDDDGFDFDFDVQPKNTPGCPANSFYSEGVKDGDDDDLHNPGAKEPDYAAIINKSSENGYKKSRECSVVESFIKSQ